jgi:alpha-ribazole phosphatase
MEIYLIRHTTPAVAKGTCYGQSDLDVTETFEQEANEVKRRLPATLQRIYSSPLQRCHKLANHVFPEKEKDLQDHFKEIHCGEWEMKLWDDIPAELLQPWMNDFVNRPFPGGENYIDLYNRTVKCFEKISKDTLPAAVFTHGGVIRSILSHITATPLDQSFSAFEIPYGAVFKIEVREDGYIHTKID